MSLKPCRECGHQAEATSCPQCGVPWPVAPEPDAYAAKFAAYGDDELRRTAREHPPSVPAERAALATELHRRSQEHRWTGALGGPGRHRSRRGRGMGQVSGHGWRRGLGIGDCRQTPRDENTWKVEFLGARPTIASALRLGTGSHAGVVPLPLGARHGW